MKSWLLVVHRLRKTGSKSNWTQANNFFLISVLTRLWIYMDFREAAVP